MKIYPQTAPEIPTGESSIGWEAGEAGRATVPPHHPPRGSGTVSANSPGSPGLRKQGLGPWREGRGPEKVGCSGHQHEARGSVGPATPGGQPAVVEVGKGTHTRAGAQAPLEAQALPWSLPLIAASSRGSPDAGDKVGDTKALGEVASSFQDPLGQPPCCLDGDHYCFRGTGKGQELQPDQESRKRPADPPHSAGNSASGLDLGKLLERFHSFLRTEGVWRRGEALPGSPAGPGAPPQAARGPKGGGGKQSLPLLPPSWGPNPVPR